MQQPAPTMSQMKGETFENYKDRVSPFLLLDDDTPTTTCKCKNVYLGCTNDANYDSSVPSTPCGPITQPICQDCKDKGYVVGGDIGDGTFAITNSDEAYGPFYSDTGCPIDSSN